MAALDAERFLSELAGARANAPASSRNTGVP
jgi:hypothetical protein